MNNIDKENKSKEKSQSAVLIGSNLKKYRKLFRMTQKNFSEYLEVGTQYYGQIERGEKIFSIDKLKDVCVRLNIKIDELLPVNNKKVSLESSLRDQYLDDIYEIISECSEKQLAVIVHVCKDVLPYVE